MSIVKPLKIKPLALAMMSAMAISNIAMAQTAPSSPVTTASPIKHVIILIGENHTFDNLYGAYVPKNGQTISNLLSKGIINADGTPGPNAALAAQAQLKNIPSSYFVSQPASNKTLYTTLPAPNTSYVPAAGVTMAQVAKAPGDISAPLSPSMTNGQLAQFAPTLPTADLPLLTTGAADGPVCFVNPPSQTTAYPPQGCYIPDTRVANYNALPNTVFQFTGATLPYDSYTGDQVHRFYHMWQQYDCNVANATAANPSGCLADLLPYVGVARNDGSDGNSLGFYNVQSGDAPLLKSLADQYTISDNYHQAEMGGTFFEHMMLATGDAVSWEPYTNNAGVTIATPPANVLANPTPKNAETVAFTNDGNWTACDTEWAQTINAYEASLPWSMGPTACTPGQYYQINNIEPGYQANGVINDAGVTSGSLTPPSSLRNIGDALNEQNISWAYYGGGYNAAVRVANGHDLNPIDLAIGTSGDYYCDICNPFSYSKSIMGNPVQRAAHIKDATNFFTDLANNNLPAVSIVKPDSFTDGHPASSKHDLFEGILENVYTALKNNPAMFAETALIVTYDEGGGSYDSGFIQPVDFFGDGPRIPLLVISPYTQGGIIDHSYSDHVSILKFIERNWGLSPLTARSRDNLPNPVQTAANPYVPTNMPALGDLWSLFNFPTNP